MEVLYMVLNFIKRFFFRSTTTTSENGGVVLKDVKDSPVTINIINSNNKIRTESINDKENTNMTVSLDKDWSIENTILKAALKNKPAINIKLNNNFFIIFLFYYKW